MKLSDKKIASLYAEARRVAGACFLPDRNFPDESEIHTLACALLSAGLVKAPGRVQDDIPAYGDD